MGPSIVAGFPASLPLDSVYQAIAVHDVSGARRLLRALHARRAGANVASVTWDYLYAESWALVEAGEVDTARAQLTAALRDIASMSVYTLDRDPQAAGLRRALGLLVQIDSARGAPDVDGWLVKYRALSTSPTIQRDEQ